MRVQPFRGAQVAAGTVVLATFCALLEQRDDVPGGVHLAVLTVALAFALSLALRASTQDGGPRAWHSALYVSAVLIAFLLGDRASDVVGASSWTADDGVAAGLFVAVAAVALPFARRGAPSCTLLAAGAAAYAIVRLGPDDPDGVRWLLLAEAVVLTLVAVSRRDRTPEHARALAGIGGLAVLAIAAVSLLGEVGLSLDGERPAASTWWLLVVLAGGFGQVAYGCVDRARGSVVLGAAALAAFVLLAAANDGGTVWLVLLGLAAAAFLVTGLRPARPLPPPPDVAAPDAEPLPLTRR